MISSRKGAVIIVSFLCVLMTISAFAVTPTPKVTPKQTSRALPTPTSKPSPLPSAKQTAKTIPVVKERVLFYNSDKNSIQKVQKSFYWVSLPSGLRRFDGKLPPSAFRKNTKGKWVISSEVVNLTKKMAYKLYKDEEARVTCYFGQYYPQIERNETKMTPGIHEGIDFACSPRNADFYSLTAGTVVNVINSDNSDEYSYCMIRTDDEQLVYYIHGSLYFVKEGDKVKVGTKLGKQGDRGAKGAYHVHVSVEKPNAVDFSRSKDTELQNEVPYDFWSKWIS